MRVLSVFLLTVVCLQAPAGQPSGNELIAKFRKAIGADKPPPPAPFVIKYRGERYSYSTVGGKIAGESLDFEAQIMGHTDKPDTYRKELTMKIGVVPMRFIEVIDGETGWYQINDSDPIAMDKGLLKARKQRELHIEIFLGRESFEPSQWHFSQPKGAQLRGHEVWVLEAKATGISPLTMYLEKQSGLLLRLTTTATDVSDAPLPGEKPKLESFVRDMHLSDWKKLSYRMFPGHLHTFHDGVLWHKLETVGVFYGQALDPKLIVMPKPRQQ